MATMSSSTTVLGACPVERASERLALCGFNQIEIFDGAHTDDWLDDLQRTQQALQAAGMTVRTVHLPVIGWEIDSPDEQLRLLAIQACIRAMIAGAQLGAESVICHPNGAHLAFTPEGYDASWQRTCASIERLAQEAQRIGIQLAMENLPAHFTPRPGMYVRELLSMIEGLGDHVGICVDAGHSTANGISPALEARQAGSKLFALHIQDNDGSGADQHLVPGTGVTDWADFRRTLREMGFAGARTFELGKGLDLEATLTQLAALQHEWSQD